MEEEGLTTVVKFSNVVITGEGGLVFGIAEISRASPPPFFPFTACLGASQAHGLHLLPPVGPFGHL